MRRWAPVGAKSFHGFEGFGVSNVSIPSGPSAAQSCASMCYPAATRTFMPGLPL